MTSTVAFIGLGHMGGPMAANLVRAGHRVLGFDLAAQAVATAAAAGVEPAASAADAAAPADAVISMLPAGRHVLALYREQGLLAAARPGTLFIDCSTIDVADARTAHEAAVAAGHRALDAPVSGGVVGAGAATLTFMAGGAGGVLRRRRAPGRHGQEGRALRWRGVRTGGEDLQQHDPRRVDDRRQRGLRPRREPRPGPPGPLRRGLHRLRAVLGAHRELPGPRACSRCPANRDYRPGFAASLMAKDLGLAANALRAGGVEAPLGLRAAEMYAAFAGAGGAGLDFSAIVRTLRPQNGTPA